MELKRGDVVVYEHSHGGNAYFNGNYGVVLHVLDDALIVDWISIKLRGLENPRPNPHEWNLQKVGHIDDF